MNLGKVLLGIGSSVVSTAFPGAGAVIGFVNDMLPDDKKLPKESTGNEVMAAIDGLPADQRSAILSKRLDIEITELKESGSTLRTMLESDASHPQTTRPKIAWQAFQIIAFVSILIVSMWAYGVGTKNTEMVRAVTDGWPFVAAILTPFVTLLLGYFGVLNAEHKNKLSAASGQPLIGGITKMIGMLRK